eukprot:scaffold30_cov416-Prasinococcus_capsulatus_cf.AAC.35
MGEVVETSVPAKEEVRIMAVSCGCSHTLVLLSCDVLCSFGRGEDGQLGLGDPQSRLKPTMISTLQGKGAKLVACGSDSCLVHCDGSETYSWGWGDFGRLGHGDARDLFLPQPVKSLSGVAAKTVACGDSHTLLITESNALMSFGRNANGQLGLGHTDDVFTPTRVTGVGKPYATVACGAEHTLATTEDGCVYTWGWGKYGNLGLNNRNDQLSPRMVESITGVNVIQTACGWRHCIVVADTGDIYTFGWNKYGQLGLGSNEDALTPALVTALAPKDNKIPKKVAGGWRHTAAIVDGSLYLWGWNRFGQLGTGNVTDQDSPQVIDCNGEEIADIACGWRHTYAITASGDSYSWGRGSDGQLGHDDAEDICSPKLVESLQREKLQKKVRWLRTIFRFSKFAFTG